MILEARKSNEKKRGENFENLKKKKKNEKNNKVVIQGKKSVLKNPGHL